MIEIFKTVSKKPHNREDGKAYCIVEIDCDTGSELVGVTEIDNKIICFGSIAIAAKEGEVYRFASDDKWYKQSDGSEVTE